MHKCYVYALVNPITDEIFYIGKGVGRRVKDHYGYEINSEKYNIDKTNIIKSYRSLGYKDEFFYIEENISNDEAELLEIYLISYLGRKDKNLGSLVNKTDGGDSPPSGDDHPSAKAKLEGRFWNDALKKSAQKRMKAGTHHSQGENNPAKVASRLGTHQHLNKKPWNNLSATQESKYIWKSANLILDLYLNNNKPGYVNLSRLLKETGILDYKGKSLQNMVKKFKSGWIPENDKEWIKFKNE